MKLGRAIEVAQACGVSLEWLATGHKPEQLSLAKETLHNFQLQTYVYIPRLTVRGAEGSGTEVLQEDIAGLMALDDQFIRQQLRRRPEDLRVITAEGDSMDPTIRDGDLLLVDTSVQKISGSRIYVLDIDGALLVKRIQQLLDGALSVRSDNPKYKEETVRPTEQRPVHIIGEVIYQAGPVRS